MNLRGQQGYSMVVLLVGMAVMAVLMTAAMPVWRQASQREKEAELIFRGQQYVRAIKLFSQRAGPGVLPPSVDVLVNQKFLRKKFKDPITGEDFDLLGPSQAAGEGPGGRGAGPAPGAGRGGGPTAAPAAPAPAAPAPAPSTAGTVVQGRGGPGAGGNGIIGVASKSKDTSIRLYNGRTHYNEWPFIYVQQVQQPGTVAPGPGGPQRGGRGSPQPGGPSPRGGPPQRGGPPPGPSNPPPARGILPSGAPGTPGSSPQR